MLFTEQLHLAQVDAPVQVSCSRNDIEQAHGYHGGYGAY